MWARGTFIEGATPPTYTLTHQDTRYVYQCQDCGMLWVRSPNMTAEALKSLQKSVDDHQNDLSHTVSEATQYKYRIQLNTNVAGLSFNYTSDWYHEKNFQDARLACLKALDAYLTSAEVHLGVRITDITVNVPSIQKIQPAVVLSYGSHGTGSSSLTLPNKEVNMYIGGNVWQSLPSDKVGDFGNNQNKGSLSMGGVQVELIDYTIGSPTYNKVVSTTRTDAQGEYGFQKINPMVKYKIRFTYDGMRYENVEYNNNLSGGYSTASELMPDNKNRSNFNSLFHEISTSPQNYYKNGQWRKAYRTVFKNRKQGWKLYTI